MGMASRANELARSLRKRHRKGSRSSLGRQASRPLARRCVTQRIRTTAVICSRLSPSRAPFWKACFIEMGQLWRTVGRDEDGP